jgi:hypothetical protein
VAVVAVAETEAAACLKAIIGLVTWLNRTHFALWLICIGLLTEIRVAACLLPDIDVVAISSVLTN